PRCEGIRPAEGGRAFRYGRRGPGRGGSLATRDHRTQGTGDHARSLARSLGCAPLDRIDVGRPDGKRPAAWRRTGASRVGVAPRTHALGLLDQRSRTRSRVGAGALLIYTVSSAAHPSWRRAWAVDGPSAGGAPERGVQLPAA